MALVNIRRDNNDPFYRYKMERLQSKIEGKGNGIKTVVANLRSVANSLARNPNYLIKWFGFELGAQTNSNPKDDRWIINGAHEATKLQDSLDGFIKKYVLCDSCKNPETDIKIKEGRILLDCKACGQRTAADIRHKLGGFILKNEAAGGKKKKEKMSRRDRAKAENNAEVNSTNGNSPHESNSDNDFVDDGDVEVGAGSDDEFTRQINADAKNLGAETNGASKEDEWAVDTSAAAVAARAKELPSDIKRSLAFDDEDEGEENGTNAYDSLGTWILDEAKAKGKVSKLEDVEIYKKAKELNIETKHKALTVLAQTIFDDDIVKQIPTRASMLQKMIGDSEKHQKAFLGGTERFVGNDNPKLIPQVPAILMAYYQSDLITEEVAKAWGHKASKKYVDINTSRKVRKAADKFLQWLDEAESDEESEEE